MNYESEIIFIDFFKNMNCIIRLTIQSKVKIIANKAMLHSPWVNTRISVASKHDMSKIELRIIDTLHLVRCLIVLCKRLFSIIQPHAESVQQYSPG